MVKVIGYEHRINDEGKDFYTLQVQGGVETVRSERTGNFYFTAKKASVPSTFNEVTCKGLIGSEIPGKVEKINCEPYDYTVRETGETLQLTFRYVFVPEGSEDNSKELPKEKNITPNPEVFSANESEAEYK